jgi:hypothetical protein
LLDAVQFEERGIPAVALVTAPFAATCSAMAELHGFRDYPFVVVPHPVTSLTPEGVVQRADDATAAVEALLLAGGVAPSTTGDAAGGESLGDIVEELATGLRSDGADLTGAVTGERTVTLTLHIPTQACAECIMPAGWLLPMFERRVRRGLGDDWAVELVDPRVPT